MGGFKRGGLNSCAHYKFVDLLKSTYQDVAVYKNCKQGGGCVKGKGFKLGVTGKKQFLQRDFFHSMLFHRPAKDGHGKGGLKVTGLVGSVIDEHRHLAVGHYVGEFAGGATG
jgi:hypothetical protein